MSKRRLNRYSQAFKDWAVELLESSDLSVAEVARQLDISPKNPYNWRSKTSADRSGNKSAEQKDLLSENIQLRKELVRLQEEQLI
ncbi:MAG: transposase [Magnetococcales bacterium]|nr:transposase [Magnetococcales bacterium]